MWFAVFYDSGFKRTLCGSKWDPTNGITGNNNAFNYLGSSTARYGCCPANKYMSSPFITFAEADSCSPCPAGTIVTSLTSIPNDETSCQLCDTGSFSTQGSTSCQLCPRGKSSSNVGSSSCDLTTIKLPDGNGEDKGDGTLGKIVRDILGTDSSKKEVATQTYGPIENWDVSDVTDLSFLFYNKATFDSDLSGWVVSRVTTMNRST